MKQPKKAIDITKLDTIIKRWKINIPMLSKEIGMPAGTFKRKANPADIQYFFTDNERLLIADQLRKIGADIQKAARQLSKVDISKLNTSKK